MGATMSENFLKDFQLEGEFAAEHGLNVATVRRYRLSPDGLPFAKFGGRIDIDLPGAAA